MLLHTDIFLAAAQASVRAQVKICSAFRKQVEKLAADK